MNCLTFRRASAILNATWFLCFAFSLVVWDVAVVAATVRVGEGANAVDRTSDLLSS
ncbi:MAG TPA: hypothetical protein VHT24_14200 [Pseudacidobacterium sp.]|nr:hypothetical protein [Pseudacidobacterium sp.]